MKCSRCGHEEFLTVDTRSVDTAAFSSEGL